MTALRRIAPLILGAAVLAAVPAGASAASKDCPPKKGTIVKKSLGRIWHQGSSLYGCTTVYAHKPKSKRLGPWKPGTRVRFDGVNVVWSVPLVRDGVRSDRMWAANVDSASRWLTGTRIVPQSGDTPAREARVRTLVMQDTGAAWLTTDGAVVAALRFPETDPQAIGGLPGPFVPAQKLLLVASYPDAPTQDAIAASLKIDEGDGEGDECGGSNPYSFLFSTAPAASPVGVLWWGSWTSTNCL